VSASDISSQALTLAEELQKAGRHADAVGLLEKLIAEDPTCVRAFELLAEGEMALDHPERALRAAQQLLEFSPANLVGHRLLGAVYLQRESWAEAVDVLRRANRLHANDAETLRTLGWALFRSGERTQGLVTLERALNLESENPLTLCDLGVVQLEMQQFERARALFRRVLDLDPQHGRARDCLAAIDRIELVTMGGGRPTEAA
jgi:tetratricopeptide (TPR) repeat protein